ncbi:hypothetical protein BKP35_09790 [Anaerobacillus arseniciselenatis]|uniref:N-acetyltransferase domain-containing protein n=2 Tax=Anaerobacillus arseniciselenatis TaxID=85682 RepID=A0A1S2LK09_9BACI|nr:hypothetical protein BKP35_09790 [Anaerobacillus arseniciselenatis]
MGLMLMDPHYRSKGLGEGLFSSFKQWIETNDFSEIRLGVLIENHRALKFWRKLGFKEFKRVPDYEIGNKKTTAIAMRIDLK